MNTALILMSGQGNRFSSDTPKQFYLYKGVPLFIYTVMKFSKHRDIGNIVLVTNKEYIGEVKSFLNKYEVKKVSCVVSGGETRSDSVINGLEVINDKDIVLIHDACRPFVDEDIISDNINMIKGYDGVVTALKAVDTPSIVEQEVIKNKIDRNYLYLHQTPQTFPASLIKKCYREVSNKNDFTDEATLVSSLGYKVRVISGKATNIKITTKEDLLFLEKFL